MPENEYNIDWSIFKEYSENTCYCKCGEIFRSHSKINMEIRKAVTQKPCPGCGSHIDCWKHSSDPEVWSL